MSNLPSQVDPLDPSVAIQENASAAVEAAHREKRAQRIKLSVLTSLLIRPLSFIIPMITIPLFLHYLGKARYGLYESVGALGAWLAFTNLGLGMGLMNRLIECDVKNDRVTARACTSTLTLAMTAMMLASMLIFSVIVWFVPWANFLGAEDPVAASEATLSVWIGGIISFLALLSSLPSNIYSGYQETHRNNIWDGIAKVAALAACLAVVAWPGFGTPGVLVASIGVPSFVRFINLIDLFTREKPWLRPSLRLFDWQALRWLASQGLLLFILQMSAVLLFQTDKLIIAGGIGSEHVTAYAILGRIFLIGYGVFMLFVTPIWPAMGEAVRRNDLAWVATTIRRMSLFGMGIMLAGGILLIVARGPMSDILARLAGGEQVNVSNSLIIAMTATFVIRAWVDSRSIVLNASGILLPQIPFYAGHAVVNAVIAILVVRRFGVEGVAWTTAITALLTTGWGYPWMIYRYIMKTDRTGETRA